MALFKSYWTVEGISPDARNAALRAADANGEGLGEWLSRLICKVSLAQRDAAAEAEESAEDTVEDIVEDSDAMADSADKLSSIERAMQQNRAAGDAGFR